MRDEFNIGLETIKENGKLKEILDKFDLDEKEFNEKKE